MPTGLPATDIRRRNPFVPKIGGFGCKTFQGAEAASLVSRLRYSNSVVKKGNTQPPPQSVSYQDFPNGSRRPPESLKRHDKRQQRPQFYLLGFSFLPLSVSHNLSVISLSKNSYDSPASACNFISLVSSNRLHSLLLPRLWQLTTMCSLMYRLCRCFHRRGRSRCWLWPQCTERMLLPDGSLHFRNICYQCM